MPKRDIASLYKGPPNYNCRAI